MITFWAGALFGSVMAVVASGLWVAWTIVKGVEDDAKQEPPAMAIPVIESDGGPPTVEGGLASLTVDGEPVWCCEEAALAYPAPCPEHAPLRDVAGYMAPQHGNPRALGMWPKP